MFPSRVVNSKSQPSSRKHHKNKRQIHYLLHSSKNSWSVRKRRRNFRCNKFITHLIEKTCSKRDKRGGYYLVEKHCFLLSNFSRNSRVILQVILSLSPISALRSIKLRWQVLQTSHRYHQSPNPYTGMLKRTDLRIHLSPTWAKSTSSLSRYLILDLCWSIKTRKKGWSLMLGKLTLSHLGYLTRGNLTLKYHSAYHQRFMKVNQIIKREYFGMSMNSLQYLRTMFPRK